MVREFGMSAALGPIGFASGSPMYLGSEEVTSRPYAEATQRVINEEVATLLREAEQHATVTLTNHRHALDRLTELLLERETIDGTAVDDILGLTSGRREPAAATGNRQTHDLTVREPVAQLQLEGTGNTSQLGARRVAACEDAERPRREAGG
jgi:cell division protease FtsH